MRAFLAAVAIVSMMVPAYAQGMQDRLGGGNKGADPNKKQEAPVRRVDEKEYKSSLERLPDKKFDPWGKVR